jgi:hypothetical protein
MLLPVFWDACQQHAEAPNRQARPPAGLPRPQIHKIKTYGRINLRLRIPKLAEHRWLVQNITDQVNRLQRRSMPTSHLLQRLLRKGKE